MRSKDQYDSVVRMRNPTGVGTMNLITQPFFPQKPSGREQLVGRFDGLAPGRLLLAPHSHAITVAAGERDTGQAPCHAHVSSCITITCHADAISFTSRSLLTDPLTKIPSPIRRRCEKPGIDSLRSRDAQELRRGVSSTPASKKDAQNRH